MGPKETIAQTRVLTEGGGPGADSSQRTGDKRGRNSIGTASKVGGRKLAKRNQWIKGGNQKRINKELRGALGPFLGQCHGFCISHS